MLNQVLSDFQSVFSSYFLRMLAPENVLIFKNNWLSMFYEAK
ncbi:MAG: hypothetical protein ACI920_004144 [Saprospiraceae bacterium]